MVVPIFQIQIKVAVMVHWQVEPPIQPAAARGNIMVQALIVIVMIALPASIDRVLVGGPHAKTAGLGTQPPTARRVKRRVQTGPGNLVSEDRRAYLHEITVMRARVPCMQMIANASTALLERIATLS